VSSDAGPAGQDEWVVIARLLRTRGRRGELSAISLSSHPERFEQLREVVLFGAEGFPDEPRSFTVEEIWDHGARLIFKFEGVETISDAETLRGAEVRVPASERFALPPGEYYHSDLVGCEVVDIAFQKRIGRVEEFLEQGGNGLLRVIDEREQEVLIPFRKEICVRIDVDSKTISVDLPEGLLELNVR
jgi:16S rRNA processing protein RimM